MADGRADIPKDVAETTIISLPSQVRFVYSPNLFSENRKTMGNNLTEKGAKAAALRAEKRAAALRENLMRRKIAQSPVQNNKGNQSDADPENRE